MVTAKSHGVIQGRRCIVLAPKVNVFSKTGINSSTTPFPLMCGCLGLTSDIGVKSPKRQVNLQTDFRETVFSCTGKAKRAVVHLFITQTQMEPTAAKKQIHCWVCNTHRFTSKNGSSQAWSPGMAKVACPPAAIKVCMPAHQSLKSTRPNGL